MAIINGQIINVMSYLEEGRTDWALALSKICWFTICILFPVSTFRFLNDLAGPVVASGGIFILLVLFRLIGFFNLVLLDEVVSRLFPVMRSALRRGDVRVLDFRIKQGNRDHVPCILKGDLCGGLPVEGDDLELEGRFSGGTFFVRRGRNRTTNADIFIRSLHSGWILIATLCLTVVFICYLCGHFDSWLYSLILGVLDGRVG